MDGPTTRVRVAQREAGVAASRHMMPLLLLLAVGGCDEPQKIVKSTAPAPQAKPRPPEVPPPTPPALEVETPREPEAPRGVELYRVIRDGKPRLPIPFTSLQLGEVYTVEMAKGMVTDFEEEDNIVTIKPAGELSDTEFLFRLTDDVLTGVSVYFNTTADPLSFIRAQWGKPNGDAVWLNEDYKLHDATWLNPETRTRVVLKIEPDIQSLEYLQYQPLEAFLGDAEGEPTPFDGPLLNRTPSELHALHPNKLRFSGVSQDESNQEILNVEAVRSTMLDFGWVTISIDLSGGGPDAIHKKIRRYTLSIENLGGGDAYLQRLIAALEKKFPLRRRIDDTLWFFSLDKQVRARFHWGSAHKKIDLIIDHYTYYRDLAQSFELHQGTIIGATPEFLAERYGEHLNAAQENALILPSTEFAEETRLELSVKKGHVEGFAFEVPYRGQKDYREAVIDAFVGVYGEPYLENARDTARRKNARGAAYVFDMHNPPFLLEDHVEAEGGGALRVLIGRPWLKK